MNNWSVIGKLINAGLAIVFILQSLRWFSLIPLGFITSFLGISNNLLGLFLSTFITFSFIFFIDGILSFFVLKGLMTRRTMESESLRFLENGLGAFFVLWLAFLTYSILGGMGFFGEVTEVTTIRRSGYFDIVQFLNWYLFWYFFLRALVPRGWVAFKATQQS